MSSKAEASCNKFQANMFDNSRCQNCFKPRELHLMSQQESEQVKPVYASWLCLAPEGTDFDNPMQRSRKWQRRFFILYENGNLQFALDESPSTVPQGILDLNLCTDISDAEARTGQKNALCIVTPEQEFFIRGDSKEVINGWSQQLLIFLQNAKQKQQQKKKKRRKEHSPVMKAASETGAKGTRTAEGSELDSPDQENGMSLENANFPEGQDVIGADRYDDGGAGDVEDHHIKSLNSGLEGCYQPQMAPRVAAHRSLSPDEDLPSFVSSLSSSASSSFWDSDEDTESCSDLHTKASALQHGAERDHRTPIHEDETWSCGADGCYSAYERESKCRTRTVPVQSEILEAAKTTLPRQRRVRTSESSMTPDLLNFKKGWLLSLDGHKQWHKYWFVLSAHSLRYYSDSGGEEASELVGEILLAACHNVTEHLLQANYGFQIHTHDVVYTLAAMTAGIRQNWIQALTKNLQNLSAPDVANISDNLFLQVETFSVPDVTQDSMSAPPAPMEHQVKTSRVAEIEPVKHISPKEEQEWADLRFEEESRSRRRRREERRQRYAVVMGFPACGEDEEKSSQDTPGLLLDQQETMREIEQRWLQVEKAAIREENRVPLYPECQSKSTEELEKLLEQYQKKVENLAIQLKVSSNKEHLLESDHSSDLTWQNPLNDLQVQEEPQKIFPNKQNSMSTLNDKYQETKELLQLENLRRQQIKSQLGLCTSAELTSELINEPEIKSESSMLNSETLLDKLSENLRSWVWCQGSRDWEEDQNWTEVGLLSESAALVSEEHLGSEPAAVKHLAQEAQFLVSQSDALQQHNQELLSQLAEANREIDRLKAELSSPPNGHQPELVRLEVELVRNSGHLLEAQTQLEEMKDNMEEPQRALYQKETMSESLFQDIKYTLKPSEDVDRLCHCGQVQAHLSELTCQQLQAQDALDGGTELQNGLRMMENGEDFRISDMSSKCHGMMHGRDQHPPDGTSSREDYVVEKRVIMRSNVLTMLLEVISHLNAMQETENTHLKPSQLEMLQQEKNIWESFVNHLKVGLSQSNESVQHLLWGAERKLEEYNMCLSALSLFMQASGEPLSRITGNMAHNPTQDSLSKLDILQNQDNKTEEQQSETISMSLIWRHLKGHVEKKQTLLDLVASKLESFTSERLLSLAESQCDSDVWNQMYKYDIDPIVSAAVDILTSCLVENVDANQKRKLDIAEAASMKSVSIQTEGLDEILEHSNIGTQENTEGDVKSEVETVSSLRDRIKELEQLLSEGAEQVSSLQQQHEKDKDNLKMKIVETYEQGFAMLKESHEKATEDLHLKHQQELELLQGEKERLLAEEAAATFTVIEAMKRVHRLELEKMLQKSHRGWSSAADSGLVEILKNHSEELASVQRELEVLSEQYTQKCVEISHLTQALQAERKALQQCQQQNLALSTRNQELNNHLAEEIIRLLTMAKEDTVQLVGDKQQYELKIMLRVKESEVICLEQELSTLKNELHTALFDQKLAEERYKETRQDLSLVKEEAERQIVELREHLRLVYEALTECMEQRAPSAFPVPTLDLLNS